MPDQISLSKNYNIEILSFVNVNKNRTEWLSFEKPQNDFGREMGLKLAFNAIYEKPYFLCFLIITFLIGTLLSLWIVTVNLVQKWTKFLSYAFHSFWWMTHKLQKLKLSFFQTTKIRWFLVFRKNLLLFTQKHGKY